MMSVARIGSTLAVTLIMVAVAASSGVSTKNTLKGSVFDALVRWMGAAIPPYSSESGKGLPPSSSASNKVLLHLKDPGYADEDVEGYEFYSYDFHNKNNNNQELAAGSHHDATTPSRSLVLDEMVPSTNTCAEEGTCSLLTNDKDDDADPEATAEAVDEEDAAGTTTQESSYVEHATSPGDETKSSETNNMESDAPVMVPVKLDHDDNNIPVATFQYSEAELAVGADLGTPQTVTDDAIRERIGATRTYLKDVVSDISNVKYDKVRSICQNKHESCTYWAVHGECQANPAYMLINCAPACESCEQLHIDTRCPMDPNPVNAWGPGDLNAMFEKIASDPTYARYQPIVLSRPSYAPGDTNETASYKIGLWMIQFDNAVSDEEADRLRELGEKEGYERSSDVGDEQPDGTYTAHVNEKRTSTNSWCTGDCYKDPVAQHVMDRIAHITGIPEANSENLQMLRYDVNQFYRTHNDYIPHQKDRQAGVRIATFYIYLNDVEEGGETNFPRNHNLSVKPKKGRAVLWPSVHDADPHEQDRRSDHQAKPVIRGIKYGANAWIHQRDFKGPNGRGC